MSDPATPTWAGEVDSSGVRHAALTPDRIDAVLADFRGYLTELLTPPPVTNGSVPPVVDLASLVAQLTALRHEVNLQTKTSRAAVEQTAEAMKLATPKPVTDTDEVIKPLVKALVDIADALTIGLRQAEASAGHVKAAADKLKLPPTAREWQPPRGFLARLFAPLPVPPGMDQKDVAIEQARDRLEKMHPSLSGLADGYAMSLRRVERVLPQFGLEPVECVGQPFDPELMEVVEAVDGNGRSGGTVVEEVRRGYRWHGKPYRFAQVKVAR